MPMFRPSLARLLAGALVLLALAGCSQASNTASATPTPSLSPTPTAPTGDYAFVRGGDLWVHLGSAPSHPLTQLHLGETPALWGDITWSPDHTTLAFVLNAPPLAPGFPTPGQTVSDPAQASGTLFLAQAATGTLAAVPGAGAVPLAGRHVAWFSDAGKPAILFTQGGAVETYDPGAAQPTRLNAPTDVWEVATRGNVLFYSRAAGITPTGAATAELHSLNMQTQTDVTLAQLGPMTLPAPATCSALLCPPDATTPAVPYTWSVSGDGSLIAYQSAQPGKAVAGATPTAGATASPAPSGTPAATGTPSPAPTTSVPPSTDTHFFVAGGNGTGARLIFTALPPPTTGATWQLALSPDGQYAALALAGPTTANYGPFIQSLAATGTLQNAGQASIQVGGTPSWAPNSGGVTLTAVPTGLTNGTPTGPQDHRLVTFLPSGQSITTELIGDDLVWGE